MGHLMLPKKGGKKNQQLPSLTWKPRRRTSEDFWRDKKQLILTHHPKVSYAGPHSFTCSDFRESLDEGRLSRRHVRERRTLEWGENDHASRPRKWAGEWAESQSLILMFLVTNVTSLSAYFLVANFSPLIKYDGECKEWGRQSEWGWGIPTKLQGLLLF